MTRSRLVTALVVVAAASLFAATVTAYAWRALYDPEQFANRASASLHDPSVREAISVRITDDVVVPARPNLLAARPLVTSVISAMVGGDAFASLFRRGVRDVHAALFRSEQHTVTLTLADVAIVLAAAVREVNPQVAAELPAGERVSLLSRRSDDIVRLARHVRTLTAGWLIAGAGAVVAAAAGSLVRPIEIEEPRRAAWRVIGRSPERTRSAPSAASRSRSPASR